MPLSEALKKQLLQQIEVDASNQNIEDDDMPTLIELINHNKRLTKLNLANNRITSLPSFSHHFVALLQHPSLTSVNLEGNGCSMITTIKKPQEARSSHPPGFGFGIMRSDQEPQVHSYNPLRGSMGIMRSNTAPLDKKKRDQTSPRGFGYGVMSSKANSGTLENLFQSLRRPIGEHEPKDANLFLALRQPHPANEETVNVVKYIELPSRDSQLLSNALAEKKELFNYAEQLELHFNVFFQALINNSPDAPILLKDVNDVLRKMTALEDNNIDYPRLKPLIKEQLYLIDRLISQHPIVVFNADNLPFAKIASVLLQKILVKSPLQEVHINAQIEVNLESLKILCNSTKKICLKLKTTQQAYLLGFLQNLLDAIRATPDRQLKQIVLDGLNISDEIFYAITNIATKIDVRLHFLGKQSVVSSKELCIDNVSDDKKSFDQMATLCELYSGSTDVLEVNYKGKINPQYHQVLGPILAKRNKVHLAFGKDSYSRDNCDAIMSFASNLTGIRQNKTRFYPSMVIALSKTIQAAPNLSEIALEGDFSDCLPNEIECLADAISSKKNLEKLIVHNSPKLTQLVVKRLVESKITTLRDFRIHHANVISYKELDNLLADLVVNNPQLTQLEVLGSDIFEKYQCPKLKNALKNTTNLKSFTSEMGISVLPPEGSYWRKIIDRNNDVALLQRHNKLVSDLSHEIPAIKSELENYLDHAPNLSFDFNVLVTKVQSLATRINSPDNMTVNGLSGLQNQCANLLVFLTQVLLKSSTAQKTVDFGNFLQLADYANCFYPAEMKSFWPSIYQLYISHLNCLQFATPKQLSLFLYSIRYDWLGLIEKIRLDANISKEMKEDLFRQYYRYFSRYGQLDDEGGRVVAFRTNAITDLLAMKNQRATSLAVTYIRTQMYYHIMNEVQHHLNTSTFTLFKTNVASWRTKLIDPQTDLQALIEIVRTLLKEHTPLFGEVPSFISILKTLDEILTTIQSEQPEANKVKDKEAKDELQSSKGVPLVLSQPSQSFSSNEVDFEEPVRAQFPSLVSPPDLLPPESSVVVRAQAVAPASIAPNFVYFPPVPSAPPMDSGSAQPVPSAPPVDLENEAKSTSKKKQLLPG